MMRLGVILIFVTVDRPGNGHTNNKLMPIFMSCTSMSGASTRSDDSQVGGGGRTDLKVLVRFLPS